jgi:peptide/nickel transport system substrate-binding protein
METTYHLRDGLTWQDGMPLTADDFALAYRVYTDPGLAFFIATPQDLFESVAAPDARTVVVHWRSLNASGGSLTFGDLDPLPSHLFGSLIADYAQGRMSRDSFVDASVWTADYVGAGPYRLERWDPGRQIEGTAFAGHVLGRRKIERITVRILIDENATLAMVLAGGQLDYTMGQTLRFEHLVTLKREWEPAGKGFATPVPAQAVFLFLQLRPEYVGDKALLDLRVRRALAHAIDRQALNDGLFDGFGAPTDTPVPPSVSFYPELEGIAPKYALDTDRASQLMSQAGLSRDGEGFFSAADGTRFHLDFTVQTSSELERMQAILSDSWRRAGFDVRTNVMGVQLFTAQETRHTLPGLGYSFFPNTGERAFYSTEIGTAANRWTGSNRSGWNSPEYDRLWNAMNATLDSNERGKDVAQMVALISENLPGFTLYFSQANYTWVASLKGPSARVNSGFGTVSKPTTQYWNIQTWQFD